jgi:hypothetical protein
VDQELNRVPRVWNHHQWRLITGPKHDVSSPIDARFPDLKYRQPATFINCEAVRQRNARPVEASRVSKTITKHDAAFKSSDLGSPEDAAGQRPRIIESIQRLSEWCRATDRALYDSVDDGLESEVREVLNRSSVGDQARKNIDMEVQGSCDTSKVISCEGNYWR